MNIRGLVNLVTTTFGEWSEDQAPRLAAALAYYAVFAIGPIVFISVAVVSLVFADAGDRIGSELNAVIGPKAASFILDFVGNTSPQTGIIATIVGVVTLLFSASVIFGEIQSSLNAIWDVAPKPNQGWFAIVRQRLFSFGMLAVAGLLLLASLVVTTLLSVAIKYFSAYLPGADFLWQVLNFVVATALAAGVFGLLYKLVPDAVIRWRDVWPGAIVTAVLFSIGQIALGLYLGQTSTTSAYGTAGSLIALLLWVNYAAQILFFGAEFTQVYARSRGHEILPASNAIAVDVKMAPGGKPVAAADAQVAVHPRASKDGAPAAGPGPALALMRGSHRGEKAELDEPVGVADRVTTFAMMLAVALAAIRAGRKRSASGQADARRA